MVAVQSDDFMPGDVGQLSVVANCLEGASKSTGNSPALNSAVSNVYMHANVHVLQ